MKNIKMFNAFVLILTIATLYFSIGIYREVKEISEISQYRQQLLMNQLNEMEDY